MTPSLEKAKKMISRAHPIGVFLLIAELYYLKIISFEWAVICLFGSVLGSIVFFVDVQILQTFIEIERPEEESLDSEDKNG
jgi:hypothetical protein